MHIISEKTLRDYWKKNRNAEPFLRLWIKDVEEAVWESPQDLIRDFPTASILKNNRAVFRINGNHLRLVAAIRYAFKNNQGTVFIRFIGSHADYDKIDATTI